MKNAFYHPKDLPHAFALSAFPGRFFALCANVAWLSFACWIYPSLEWAKKTLIHDDEEAIFILESLEKGGHSDPYEVGDWVILRRGTYKGDIGRVREFNSTTGIVVVAVVPRVGVNVVSKSLRPNPALFFPPILESEVLDSGHYVFKKGIYKDGLLYLRISSILHLKKASPTLPEIGLFVKTESSLGDLDRDEPFLQAGDRIRVLTTGISGEVKLILEETVTVIHAKDACGKFVDDLNDANVSGKVYFESKYTKPEIERVLLVGMNVIVRAGDFTGESGMVVGFSSDKKVVRIASTSYNEVCLHIRYAF